MVALILLCAASKPVALRASEVGSNLFSGVPYEALPVPNYVYAPDDNGTKLTDGVFAGGRFWTNKRTAGWSWRSPIIVRFANDNEITVDKIRVQIGANRSVDIFYPTQIIAFGGDGAGGYELLASGPILADEESPFVAQTRFVDIQFPAKRIKELVLVVFARGAYVFIGEMQATGQGEGGASLVRQFASLDGVKEAAAKHRRLSAAKFAKQTPLGPNNAERWAMPLAPAQGGEQTCTIVPIDPWTLETVEPNRLVQIEQDPVYSAWKITNTTQSPQHLFARGAESVDTQTKFHYLGHAQALNYAWVPDVVIPFQPGQLPAQSEVILFAEIKTALSGETRADIELRCGGTVHTVEQPLIPIETSTSMPAIHGNLWAYLHEPLHAPVASALTCDNEFLNRYGIDTGVVHPSALVPRDGQFPSALLRDYFQKFRKAKRILLFMDIDNRHWPFESAADPAAELKRWWNWVVATAASERVSAELLLYPIDEPTPGELAMLQNFAQLRQTAGLEVRLYATGNKTVAARLGATGVDVAQVHWPALKLAERPGAMELHGYDTRFDAKLQSPQSYYRRQGWEAFDKDLAGTGIWSLWDSTGAGAPETGFNPFGIRERDFGMLYKAPSEEAVDGGCAWPSRRLLAWSRGLAENRILRYCAKSVPDTADQIAKDALRDFTPQSADNALHTLLDSCVSPKQDGEK